MVGINLYIGFDYLNVKSTKTRDGAEQTLPPLIREMNRKQIMHSEKK